MRTTAGRIAVAVAAVVILVGLFAFLRARGDHEAAATTTTEAVPTTTPTQTTPTTNAPPPPPPPPAGPRRIRVSVQNDQVQGGVQRPTLNVGDRVVLVVRADVSDHVHVHGYDRFADVAPGRPAQISLHLTIPGRFEVELEDRRFRIAELEVRP